MDKQTLLYMLQKPVAFYPVFAQITNSALAGLFLSQAFYWTGKSTHESDGWFHKTMIEWSRETEMTKSELETARNKCKALGIIEEKLQGVPPIVHYRVNVDQVWQLVQFADKSNINNPGNQFPKSGESIISESTNIYSVSDDIRLIRNAAFLDSFFGPLEKKEKDRAKAAVKSLAGETNAYLFSMGKTRPKKKPPGPIKQRPSAEEMAYRSIMNRICFMVPNEEAAKSLSKQQVIRINMAIKSLKEAGANLNHLENFAVWWAGTWMSKSKETKQYQPPRPEQVCEYWWTSDGMNEVAKKANDFPRQQEMAWEVIEAAMQSKGK